MSDPFVFVQHMTGSLAPDRVELLPLRFEVSQSQSRKQELIGAIVILSELGEHPFALGAPLVIHSIGEPPR